MAQRLELIAGTTLQEEDLALLSGLTWLQHLDLGGFATITDTILQVTMPELQAYAIHTLLPR